MSILDKIKESIFNEISASPEFVKSLQSTKVFISIVDGPKVLIKIIKILRSAKKNTIIPKETRDKIKIIKKAVKINADVSYLFALIKDVKQAIDGLDFKHITEEAAREIKQELIALDALLNKATLRIEQLPNSGGDNVKD